MKDLFISHASEDKDELVRPLAELLQKAGMDIWYDEYSIHPGDSISASIDKGLINCNYGLIIISPSFLKKKWTDYELKSLISKEVNRGKTIIPIWHNVDYDQVADRSLYLADKEALNSSKGIELLSYEVIKAVRPEIINSFALKEVGRRLNTSGKKEKRHINELYMGEVKHHVMPKYVVLASKMIDSAFPGISSHKEFVENLAKDYNYDEEFLLWCVITSAYLDTVYALERLPSKEEMHTMLSALIGLSFGDSTYLNATHLTEAEKLQLGNAYLKNAEILFSLSTHKEEKK